MSKSMPERSAKELVPVKALEGPIEQDPSATKPGRHLCISRARVGHMARTHALPISAARARVVQPLGKRQVSILAFVRDFTAHNHYPPTIREITEGCSLSSTSLSAYHLTGLEEKGYLTRTPAIARGIVLTELGMSETKV